MKNHEAKPLETNTVLSRSVLESKLWKALRLSSLFMVSGITAGCYMLLTIDYKNSGLFHDSVSSLILCFILFGIFLIIIQTLQTNNISNFYRKESKEIEDRLRALSEGNIPTLIPQVPGNMPLIPKSLNSLIFNLQRIKNLAADVGQGKLFGDLRIFDNNGDLGKALEKMQLSLQMLANEEKRRTWAANGEAYFAKVLRQTNVNYEDFSIMIIKELVGYIKACQGAIFILNEQTGDPFLEMTGCYAYERRKHISKSLAIGEGLAGQVFLEQEAVLITEVPPGYLNISSGLGDAPPKSILIVPLKFNDKVIGIIELSSFQDFTEIDKKLVEKLGEGIASSICNLKISEETNMLLRESLSKGEQLKLQEEQMRQSLEELQATQEQIQKQAEEMISIQDSLMLEKSMFQVLMEYSPDRLTYKDMESRVLRVNKAKAKRFKLSPEEMIGTTDYDFFPAEHAAKAIAVEKELLRAGEPKLDILEKVLFDDGKVNFINTSRIPFRNEKGKLVGTCTISKDITQSKLNETEISIHQQMFQNLLENFPVINYQIGADGEFKNFDCHYPPIKHEQLNSPIILKYMAAQIVTASQFQPKGKTILLKTKYNYQIGF